MNLIKSFFDENGYYLARGVFSAADLMPMESDFNRIVTQLVASNEEIDARWKGPEVEKLGGMSTRVIHTHMVEQYSAVWLRALLHEGFLDVAEAILGPDIVLHHTKLFQKPAEEGAPFPMHQDWTYFPSEKGSMIAGIIHVSDATDEMGCLRVYPGSHRLGGIPGSHGQADSEMLARYPIEGATVLEAEAGDVVFFSYFTIHGSMPNRSSRIRKTVLAQLHAGDDIVDENPRHPDQRLTLRGWNHRMTRSVANRVK